MSLASEIRWRLRLAILLPGFASVESRHVPDELPIMSLNLNSDEALIFRITHRDNLQWILDHGLHARKGEIFDPNYRNIGNLDLIDKRGVCDIEVEVKPPGGPPSSLQIGR